MNILRAGCRLPKHCFRHLDRCFRPTAAITSSFITPWKGGISVPGPKILNRAYTQDFEREEDALPSDPTDGADDAYGLIPQESQYEPSGSVSKRIHILGAGNVAVFLAHSLAGISDRPLITLLLTDKRMRYTWEESGRVLRVETRGSIEERDGFEVEYIRALGGNKPSPTQRHLDEHDPSHFNDESATGSKQKSENIIEHLIVTVKATFVVTLIRPLLNRLNSNSTICFLSLGMGVLEEVATKLFPDENQRPHFVAGIFSHQVRREKHFHVEHFARGQMALSLVRPRRPGKPTDLEPRQQFAPSTKYLLRTLTRTPILVAVGVEATEFFQQQLDHLAMSAIIQPLTALYDCENAKLLNNWPLTRVVRLLLSEICFVFKNLPELRNVPNVNMRYDPERLEKKLIANIQRGSDTHSTTLLDVRYGRRTEVESMNGYIVKRGEEMGHHCVTNFTIMNMVLALTRFSSLQKQSRLPIRQSRERVSLNE